MKKLLVTLSFLLVVGFLATSAQADTFEVGWDRPGWDYQSFELNNPREILCQWSCQKDRRCVAWTYVKPGYQAPRAKCWLKNRIPKAVKNSCCTSGYIQ